MHSIFGIMARTRRRGFGIPRSLLWSHNGGDSVSNHQPRDCLLNRLFKRRSKKTSKLRVTGLCVGNSSGTGEFPAQIASNAENVSIFRVTGYLMTSSWSHVLQHLLYRILYTNFKLLYWMVLAGADNFFWFMLRLLYNTCHYMFT